MSSTTGEKQAMWIQCSFRRQNLRKTSSGRSDQLRLTVNHCRAHPGTFLRQEKQEGGEEKGKSNPGEESENCQ